MGKTSCYFRSSTIHALLILLVGFAVYSNTFSAPFVFDDDLYIINNPLIKDFQYFKDPSSTERVVMSKNVKDHFKMRTAGYFTFALNYSQHYLDVTGYHVVNLLVHLMNALLVYCFVVLLLRTLNLNRQAPDEPFNEQWSALIALLTALLFVAHPIQTQAVTYITQRFTSLATLFYLLAIVMYMRWRLEKQKQEEKIQETDFRSFLFYMASIFSAVLAMMTKEIAFTLPVLICFYELMFFKESMKKRAHYLIPPLLTMLIIPLTLLGPNTSGAEVSRLNETAAGGASIARDYLYTQFRVIITYLRLLFLPVDQNLDYDYPVYKSFFRPEVYLSFLFLLSVMWTGGYLWHRSEKIVEAGGRWLKLISFGILWFFVTLSVESWAVPLFYGTVASEVPLIDVIFEHRVYLPSVGFFMAVMGTLFFIADKNKISVKITIPVLVLIIAVFAVTAYERNLIWQDGGRFLEDVARKNPGKAKAHSDLCMYYENKGRLDNAYDECLVALKLNHDFAPAHNNLGNLYAKQGRAEEALREYETAVKLDPYFAIARSNLGNLYEKQGRTDDAIREYQIAIELNPYFPEAHNNLGLVYAKQDRLEEAVVEHQAVINLAPNFPGAYNELEVLKKKLNDKNKGHNDRGQTDDKD